MRVAGASFLRSRYNKQAARNLALGAISEIYESKGRAPIRGLTLPGPEALRDSQSVEREVLSWNKGNRLWVAEEDSRARAEIREQIKNLAGVSLVGVPNGKALDFLSERFSYWGIPPLDFIYLDGMGALLGREIRAIFRNSWLAYPSVLVTTVNMTGRCQRANNRQLGLPEEPTLPESRYRQKFLEAFEAWLPQLAKRHGYTAYSVSREVGYSNENWQLGHGPGRGSESMLQVGFTFKSRRSSQNAYAVMAGNAD